MRYQKADLRRNSLYVNWSHVPADWYSTPAERTRYSMSYTAWVVLNRRFRKRHWPELLRHGI